MPPDFTKCTAAMLIVFDSDAESSCECHCMPSSSSSGATPRKYCSISIDMDGSVSYLVGCPLSHAIHPSTQSVPK